MKRTIAYALAGVLLASSAHAATLPPLEYDHPYAGRLDVIVAENAEQIRIGCPTTGGGSLGLALRPPIRGPLHHRTPPRGRHRKGRIHPKRSHAT